MRRATLLLRRPAALVLLPLLLSAGCTRHFFRSRADVEVDQVLRDKDQFPFWKIEQYNGAYPDARARFADPTNPDRPPMPPDDPAARVLAPSPQKPPHKGGVARVEGTGYLQLLEVWDSHNRQMLTADAREPEVPIRTKIETGPENRVETPAPRADACAARRPYLLTMDQAVELGIVNSREFQTRREDLYLAALPVTVERFGFAAQFFGAEEAILERTGRKTPEGPGSRWRLNGEAGFAKLFPTGALLLVQYANRTVINLSGRNAGDITSLGTLNLDLVQPLLRGGGRAVTLEPLTQAERNLLYEIRDFARFRKEYYQFITGGGEFSGALGGGAVRGGGIVPGAISPGTGNGAALQLTPGNAVRIDLSSAALASSEGYLNTLQRQAQISIERANISRLDKVIRLFQAYETGGRVTSLQVGQTQLQLLNAQSALLAAQRDAKDSLDRFKLQLGLPLDVPLELDDRLTRPLLKQFTRFEELFAQFNATLERADALDDMSLAPRLRDALLELLQESEIVRGTKVFREQFPLRWQAWRREVLDDKALFAKVAAMRQERLRLLDEKETREANDQALSPEDADKLKRIEADLPLGDWEFFLRRLEAMPWKALPTDRARREEFAARFRDVRNGFSDVLAEASNERLALLRPRWPQPAPVIVGGLDLIESELEPALEVATRTALEQRLDLMNARANVVDAWRAIAVNANALQGVFNVGYHMDSTTPPNDAKPLAFSGPRTRHQLVMNLELPFVRVAERNGYRASLIAYQRARRGLMAGEDLVANQVRSGVRNLQVLARNLRIQQKAVEIAFQQVESALETFQSPPTPGAGSGDAVSAASLTQQLLGAYGGLPNQQRNLLTTWIAYQVARQQLYLDLEQMPLDFRGVWIDEYSPEEPQVQGARLHFRDP